LGLAAEKVRVIHNGIDLEGYHAENPKPEIRDPNSLRRATIRSPKSEVRGSEVSSPGAPAEPEIHTAIEDWTTFGVWVGVLGWALQGLVEFGLYIPALAWPAFALLGWLLGRNREWRMASGE